MEWSTQLKANNSCPPQDTSVADTDSEHHKIRHFLTLTVSSEQRQRSGVVNSRPTIPASHKIRH
ncbi:hypothetical protein J6590_026733 [Homalodisca vitripennis]|nr:hypothetical protein J6590_026733 [Homalodisca vitripennis]